MTLDEFFDELAATPGPWHIRSGEIRCARGACPINAVMHRRDEKHMTLYSFTDAAYMLGLRTDTAIEIARAADMTPAADASLRVRLLSCLGLAEIR